MTSLTSVVLEFKRLLAGETVHIFGDMDPHGFIHDAAIRHVDGTHITTTYPDGSSGRKEVQWNAEEQRFVDWGNNYWLYGPQSSMGERAGGEWVLGVRHANEVIVTAILDRAKMTTKTIRDSNWVAQRMWRYYWELLLMDTLRHAEDAIVDLRLAPLDVDGLAPKPEPVVYRQRDRITV